MGFDGDLSMHLAAFQSYQKEDQRLHERRVCNRYQERGAVSGLVGDAFVDQQVLEERNMLTVRKRVWSLYVEKGSQQWIVLDPEGNFWMVPSDDSPWDHRQPFHPTEETELEPVPGHYKYMLGLPF